MPDPTEDPCLKEVRALASVVGAAPDAKGNGGAGVAGDVHEMKECIGRAPNKATGDPGAGMARVVAELAETKDAIKGWLSPRTMSGGALATVIAMVILEVLTRCGVIPPAPHVHEYPPPPSLVSDGR